MNSAGWRLEAMAIRASLNLRNVLQKGLNGQVAEGSSLIQQNGGGIVHTAMRPQETPLAESDINDTSRRQLYMILQRCTLLARLLDGCATDVQGAL